jgi:hypothetical protein
MSHRTDNEIAHARLRIVRAVVSSGITTIVVALLAFAVTR